MTSFFKSNLSLIAKSVKTGEIVAFAGNLDYCSSLNGESGALQKVFEHFNVLSDKALEIKCMPKETGKVLYGVMLAAKKGFEGNELMSKMCELMI